MAGFHAKLHCGRVSCTQQDAIKPVLRLIFDCATTRAKLLPMVNPDLEPETMDWQDYRTWLVEFSKKPGCRNVLNMYVLLAAFFIARTEKVALF
jgi:hypothetical protein